MRGWDQRSACTAGLLLLLATALVTSNDFDSGALVPLDGSQRDVEEPLMLVGVLDGRIHAVDPQTGQDKWVFDSGTPLVSASSNLPFLPGADGTLYQWNQEEKRLAKVPWTVRELVEASPSVTLDGQSVVLGERHSTVFYLHRHSGERISEFSASKREAVAQASSQLGDVSMDDVVALGRVEYTVQATDPVTEEVLWHLKHFSWVPIFLPNVPSSSVSVFDLLNDGLDMDDQALSLGTDRYRAAYKTLLSPKLGFEGAPDWQRHFEEPPVFAMAIHAQQLDSHPLRLPDPSSMGKLLKSQLNNALVPRTHKATRTCTGPDAAYGWACTQPHALQRALTPRVQVMVGKLSDSLYALPYDHELAHSSRLDSVLDVPRHADAEADVESVRTSVEHAATFDVAKSDVFMPLQCPLGLHNAYKPRGSLPASLPERRLPRRRDPFEHELPPPILRQDGPWVLSMWDTILIATVLGVGGCLVFFLATMSKYNLGRHPQLPVSWELPADNENHASFADHLYATTHDAGARTQTQAARAGDVRPNFRKSGSTESSRGTATSEGAALLPPPPGPEQAPLPDAQQPSEIRTPDGRTIIGNLEISSVVLGYGSSTHGTIVFEGSFGGRPVAVKRMLAQFHEVARKEIEALIVSDEHPNVLRCFAMERSGDFVYLALERCSFTLYDAFTKDDVKDRFVASGGSGSTDLCWRVARDMIAGLQALHDKGIVHRDLKPQNVLLTEALRAKVSDMGLSKQLVLHQSSFDSLGVSGSSGWQAPEQILLRDGNAARQTKAVDVFSLGCVLFYCFTEGGHPFGEDRYQRDANILHREPDLWMLDSQPELTNLLRTMMSRHAEARPSMAQVLEHPVWWTPQQRLQLLIDVSDRFETDDRADDQRELQRLESCSRAAFSGDNWAACLEPALVSNLYQYRRYKYSSLRDLLRVIRNKANHFREMPPELQTLMGHPPNDYFRYFAQRFPRLFLTVFFFVTHSPCRCDALFAKYNLSDTSFAAFEQTYEAAAAAAHKRSSSASRKSSPIPPPLPPSLPPPSRPDRPAPAVGEAGQGKRKTPSRSTLRANLEPADAHVSSGNGVAVLPEPSASMALAVNGGVASDSIAAAAAVRNTRTNAADRGSSDVALNGSKAASEGQALPASSGMLNGQSDAVAPPSVQPVPLEPLPVEPESGDPPPLGSPAQRAPNGAAAASGGGQVLVGWRDVGCDEGECETFPLNPGAPLCQFFAQTGHCKFGATCFKDHPVEFAVMRNRGGFPIRTGKELCSYYMTHGTCKFGPSCKFHHPNIEPLWAGADLNSDLST